MAADDVKVFDWDDEIEDDGEERSFVTLEPGKYDFTVTDFERAYHEHKEGGKAPSCPMAIVTVRVSTEDGDCYIKENFLLYKKMEWKISQFFRSLGMKKHGEKVKQRWSEIVGQTGRAEVTKESGKTDGVYFNHIKTWLEKTEQEAGGDEWS